MKRFSPIPDARKQLIISGFIVVAMSIVGSWLVLHTHAATGVANIEAENGTVASPATGVVDATASGGRAVAFGSAAPSNPVPAGIPGSWTLKFDDEFNGTSLDTTKWSTGWFGSGITKGVDSTEQDCYDPAQVAVSSGSLNITAIAKSETCAGVTQPYTTGLINSNGKYSFTYGAMEASIWVPGSGSTIYDWPAWWTDGQNWPTDGEIDVLEGLGGVPCYHFHYSGGGPGGCTTVTNAATGYHTYAASWEPGAITYYYDGKQVWQTTTGITASPMYLILNLSISANYTPTVPSTMKVDYVRVWQ